MKGVHSPSAHTQPGAATTVADVLAAAADLIEPAGKWLQGGLAGDEHGRPLGAAVTGADFCAKCWCAVGAIDKAVWNMRCVQGLAVGYGIKGPALDALMAQVGQQPADWNDAPGRTQAEVVAALRAAAAVTKGEGRAA